MTGLGQLAGGLTFAGFCGLAVWIWVPDAPQTIGKPDTAATTVSARVQDGVDQLAEMIPVTTDRPLFHASRRPMQAAAPVAAPAAPEQTLSLVGILGQDGTRVALVRISGNSELFQVDAGGQLGPWQILAVGDNYVEVSKDGGDPLLLGIGE